MDTAAFKSTIRKLLHKELDLLEFEDPSSPDSVLSGLPLETSLEGSPLKLQEFKLNSYTTSTSTEGVPVLWYPLKSEEARYLLSLYALSVDPYSNDSLCTEFVLPLWVLCDGQGIDHTVCMGIRYEKDAGCLRTFSVTMQGPLHEKSEIQKLASIKAIKSKDRQVSVKCSADYEILAANDSGNTDGNQGTLNLCLSWNTCSKLLEQPPLYAKVIVNSTVVAGDTRSSACSMYKEFCILKVMAQGLVDGTIRWPARQEHNLLADIKQLIEDVMSGKMVLNDQVATVKNEIDGLMSPIKNVLITERKDLDFTDHLWIILKDCSSYNELLQCYELLFTSLKNLSIQPSLHKNNKSTLAELVRESYFNELSIPKLTGQFPLQMLVEIGIEKLKQDCTYALVGWDMVTVNHLHYFLESSINISEKIIRLDKLHHVIALVVQLDQFLELPRVTQSISARAALKYYEHHPLDNSHVFSTSVQTSDIANLIEDFDPCVWKVEFKHGSAGEDRTVCMLSTKSPFKHVKMTNGLKPDADESEAVAYYFTQLNQTTDCYFIENYGRTKNLL